MLFDNDEKPLDPNILKLMHNIMTAHELGIVRFKEHKKTYNTLLLDIDKDKQILSVDAFFPESGHRLAKEGKEFNITFHHNGVPISFKSKLIEEVTDEGGNQYNIIFPRKVRYHQKRNYFRVRQDNNELIPVNVTDSSGDLIDNCFIKDISFSGMQMYIMEQDLSKVYQLRSVIKNISFKNYKEETIIIDLYLCRVSYDKIQNLTVLAGKFHELEADDEKIITAFVCELERLQLKKKSDKHLAELDAKQDAQEKNQNPN